MDNRIMIFLYFFVIVVILTIIKNNIPVTFMELYIIFSVGWFGAMFFDDIKNYK
jgi:hypothetical protein